MNKIILRIVVWITMSANLVAQTTLKDSLVAHYPFINGSVADVTGNGHNGTNLGAVATLGFEGDTNGAYITSSAAIKISNYYDITNFSEFSICAWIKPSSHPTHSTVIAKVTPNRDFDLKTSSGRPQIHFAQGSTYWTSTSPDVIPLNQWTHVTGTWDGSHLKMFVNDQLKYDANHSGQSPPWTGTLLHIGSLTGSGERFQGAIDDVRIYNRVLTDCEIVLLYDSIPVDNGISNSGDTLFSADSLSTYKWVNCDSSMSFNAGDTNSFFVPTVNGNYAAIVSKGICIDTSACLYVQVTPPNLPPIISTFSDYIMCKNATLGPLAFSIMDEDSSTVSVSAVSDNPPLIPVSGLLLTGSGSNRALTVTPGANMTGAAKITVILTDNIGQMDTTEFTVVVNDCDPPQGLDELDAMKISIHPNPVKDYLRISGTSSISEVSIFDPEGRRVYHSDKVSGNSVDIRYLDAGIYFVMIKTRNQSLFKKLIVE